MTRITFPSIRESAPWLILVSFLALVFLTGGGARSDVQSLIILRPAAIFATAFALWGFTRQNWITFRPLLIFSVLTVGMVALHLVPLPPAIWAKLPGRGIVHDVDQLAGLGNLWRPISLTPFETWNAFYSLFIPVAALTLLARVGRDRRYALLPIIIFFGLASGLLGLMQAVGSGGKMLYLYQVTNEGSAVGLFSNRNHQALLLACLFPLLAVYASTGARSIERAQMLGWLAVGIGVLLIPLLLVTGSRAGIILGIVGLLSVPLVNRRPQFDVPPKRKHRRFNFHYSPNFRYVAAAVAAAALAIISVLLARGEAFERLLETSQFEDKRFLVWEPIFRMAMDYFPVGSGFGSFVEVYQLGEPANLLAPTYLNHAHNDLLEILLTGGLPAIILLCIAIVAWVRRSISIWSVDPGQSTSALFARLGSIIVLLLAIASLVDYPLRTPLLACLLVIAAVWMLPSTDDNSVRRRRSHKDVELTSSLS